MDQQPRIRIELTEQQKQQIRAATAKEVESIELSVQELEERIAPSLSYGGTSWTYKPQ